MARSWQFSSRDDRDVAAGFAGVSRLRANRSRSLRNLTTQRSRIPLAARSAGLPHDRARKAAQDAVSRNREPAIDDFSDGRKASPTRPHWQSAVDKKIAHPLAAASSRRATLPCVNERAPPASVQLILSSAQALRCQARVRSTILAKAADSEWAMAALTRLTRSASSAVPHGRRAGGSRVEEDFPAAPKEPEANPWLPETYEHAGRPRGASAPSEKRAQEAHGQRGQEVGPVSDKGRHEGLGRRDRLRARSCFLAAQQRGRRISGRNLVVYVLSRSENERKERARLGITVSKKVGNAVVRNRVKRWLRESYRRMASAAPGGTDLVIIARPATAYSTYQRTAEELSQLIARAGVP